MGTEVPVPDQHAGPILKPFPSIPPLPSLPTNHSQNLANSA